VPAARAAPRAETALEGQGQLLEFKWLCQVVARAKPDGVHRFLDSAESGHDHDPGILRKCPLAQQLEDVAIRQMQIHQRKLKSDRTNQAPGFFQCRTFTHLRAQAGQIRGCSRTQRTVVLEHEDFAARGDGGFFGHGRYMRGSPSLNQRLCPLEYSIEGLKYSPCGPTPSGLAAT